MDFSTPEGKNRFDYDSVIAACRGTNDSVKVTEIRRRLLYHFCSKVGCRMKSRWSLLFKKTETEILLEGIVSDVVSKVQSREISDGRNMVSYVYARLDETYLSMLRSKVLEPTTDAERFYHGWFIQYLHAKDFRKVVSQEDGRMVAFNEAFTKCIIKVKNGWFHGDSSLFTFFMKIFGDECASYARKTYKRSFEDLDDDIANTLREPPATLAGLDIAQLRNYSPDCMDLLERKVQGYSYKELAEERATTLGNIKNMLYECKKKLARYWEALHKNE